MWSVFCALIPAGIGGVIIFGFSALRVILISLATCITTEFFFQRISGRKVTIQDGSAAVTGILLAYNLPSSVPFWIPVVGGFFAILIAKQCFGGLGMNIFNPALAARAFLLSSWPQHMTSFPKPFTFDAVTASTPLMLLKEGKSLSLDGLGLSYLDLLLGKRGGCIGEVCILALLFGAGYLLWRRYITWHIPISFILSLGILSYCFGPSGFLKGGFLFSFLTGGVILGAFFMASDYATSPMTSKGRVVFGIGCGCLTFLIRRFGGYPEGVSYSILMMNAFVPLLDRFIRPHRFAPQVESLGGKK